jgi:NADPH:quinone reductase-like Zn-dependent oxidoreductase
MAGAAGVVEQAEGDLAKGDLVFAPTLRCAWGDAATVTVDAKALVKVPPSVPHAQAAHLGAAAAAAALLDGAVAGDVVLHLGGEGAVGQVAAQLCAARGVSLVSLVGADVADAEDAVEVLKNLGAACAGAAKESVIPNFKGSYLGRFPLVSADFWTSDHLSERSRSVDAFPGTLKRR